MRAYFTVTDRFDGRRYTLDTNRPDVASLIDCYTVAFDALNVTELPDYPTVNLVKGTRVNLVASFV